MTTDSVASNEKSSFDARPSSASLFLQTKLPMSLPETQGRKLLLFQQSDPFKEWRSLSEMRRCAKCGHLFTGCDIQVDEEEDGTIRFRCPTVDCEGSWADWEYHQLHL